MDANVFKRRRGRNRFRQMSQLLNGCWHDVISADEMTLTDKANRIGINGLMIVRLTQHGLTASILSRTG